MDISTNSNVVLESEMEWQPAAFSATNKARRREYTCRTISSTPKGWSFLHSLSCNPHCSLQHYQMKENPTAFGKKWSFWMFDYKKTFMPFFLEDYCGEKPHILTSVNHISSETPFKEFRCDDCLESRRWTEANSSFLQELHLILISRTLACRYCLMIQWELERVFQQLFTWQCLWMQVEPLNCRDAVLWGWT